MAVLSWRCEGHVAVPLASFPWTGHTEAGSAFLYDCIPEILGRCQTWGQGGWRVDHSWDLQ